MRKTPAQVAGSASHVGARRLVSSGLFKKQRFQHKRQDIPEPRGQKEANSSKLGQSEATPMPSSGALGALEGT